MEELSERMEEMEYNGSWRRIKNCALDFLSVGCDPTEEEEWWDWMQRNVLLKSMFFYCDFCKMIPAAPPHQKKPLSHLATALLSSFQELENALKLRSVPRACDGYEKASAILQEIIGFLMT
ncbi:hypothetical protein Nepgr_012754 [Nepenthes gracilis]|uniref:Uncharacterized protein n=1 Tax=Nepenthes gracilis TaxID=150966 RepID=A0AAD3SGJ4_NEPGR|nr:hypothetical protein Nepgr_012754 [Nepenthes gracilis]